MTAPAAPGEPVLLAGIDGPTTEIVRACLDGLGSRPEAVAPDDIPARVRAGASALLMDRAGCPEVPERLAALRADASLPPLPVLVLAAGEGPRERMETLEAGANDVLSRPYEPGELAARLRAMLTAERQRKRLVESQRERSRLTADLSRQSARLDEISRLTDHYASVLNHDLRSPITNIKGYTDLLQQEVLGPLTDDQRQSLEVIQRNAGHLLGTLDMLVDLRHIETGKLQLQLGQHEIRRIVADAIDRYAGKAEEKGIRIEPPALAEGTEGLVVCDRRRIGSALEHYLSNAVTYCRRDDTVQVLTRQVGERLEIAVRDSGPGIPEAEHGKVFERFARLTPRPTAHEKTAGLGLSLAKALVELHEGTVGFESRPGGGSRFWLRIPRPAPGRRTE